MKRPRVRHQILIALGFASWAVYVGITWISPQFAYEVPADEHPVVETLLLFAAAFGYYVVALRIARTLDCLPTIIIFSVCFRATVFFSVPIQEIDIYRYLWDGQCSVAGVNPFAYTPHRVLDARSDESLPDDLSRLVKLRDSSPALQEVLERVHFGELPTVYPPVSQAVFALATSTTPNDANVRDRLLFMKAWILAFDLATLIPIVLLLRLMEKPTGWALAYAWCPLIIKEFANSGHLDSIAIFFTTLAVYSAALACRRRYLPTSGSTAFGLLAALSSGLAIGAKLYPVVILPVVAAGLCRHWGFRRTAAVVMLAISVALLTCWPLIRPTDRRGDVGTVAARPNERQPVDQHALEPPLPPQIPIETSPQDSRAGLRAFLSRWEMNDLLFMIVVENLNPDNETPAENRPWFLITSYAQRTAIANAASRWFAIDSSLAPFLLARLIAASVFACLVGYFMSLAYRASTPSDAIEAVFLTLAWFWLLLPTQNPWYWLWAIPFLPFAKSRAWLWVSGLVFVYYLRFWLIAHWPDTTVYGSRFSGELLFDFVVTWIEFGPWFVWLALAGYYGRRRRMTNFSE